MKPRILVLCDFYLPGFKGGGGMWTVVNLVNRFCDKYDFFVVARNYDGRDDMKPYSEVKTGEWNDVGNAKVFYLSDSMMRESVLTEIVTEVSPKIVFLNAFFATPSILFSFARWKGKNAEVPVILAPCGNLSEEAINLKPFKKRAFIVLSRFIGFHKDIIWKASSDLEKKEILNAVGSQADVRIAPDLPPQEILPEFSFEQKPAKSQGEARLACVSRVVKKKNLDFLLTALSTITDRNITLDIVGLQEEQWYWEKCRSIISTLPPNIKVNAVGGVRYDEALKYMVNSHFFVLPTLNENFGYVFIEAMAAGCPLMISDRTMWNGLREKGIGWNLPLDSAERWVDVIRKCCDMGRDEYAVMSQNARKYAVEWLSDPSVEAATAKILEEVIGS
ncbi:MAG: glycosyltransferase [Acidobacteria bacterium]|nr:glycosyltransferase [Acidobacteriota bacterium]